MNRRLQKAIIPLALGLLSAVFVPAQAQEQDVKGSKDHALISRYPGCAIRAYAQKEYDEYLIPLGKALGAGKLEKTLPLEGNLTLIDYTCPKGRSTLEVFRNFEGAMKRAGFESLFACALEACGEQGFVKFNAQRQYVWVAGRAQRQLSAKLSQPDGEVYVNLHVDEQRDGPYVYLDVIEMKPMEAGLVTVNAEALAGDISRTGHVAIYGIYFDTGKADVKPESEPTLAEIAKLLQQNPQLKLHVVGHTDSVGELVMNMDLSKRRAQAVVQALTAKHGIAAARLRPDGVGPLSPIATNKTEEGRAQNRRVELVEQ